MSDRQLRRWRWQKYGYEGLYDRRRQRPGPGRVPVETVEAVLRLYRERYFDFNVKHFVEKLHEEHGIRLSYTWVKTALQTAGLVARATKRGAHRKARPQRPAADWAWDRVMAPAAAEARLVAAVDFRKSRRLCGMSFSPCGPIPGTPQRWA